MKISEMISELQLIKEEYGDLPVAKWLGVDYCECWAIEYLDDQAICREIDDKEYVDKIPFVCIS